MFKVDKIQIVDQCPSDIRYVRSWDLASTNKELSKGDPDYTAGAKVGIKLFYHPAFPDIKRYQIYLKHMVRGRWESPERDRTIKQTAQTDGQPVPMLIEVVGGYKDTFTRIAEMLIGVSQVNEFNPDGDKVARAAEIESEIEGGEFYIERADWNSAFLDEMREFPGGKHDDQVDAVVNAVKHLKTFTKFQFGEFKARGKDEKVDYYKA
jgi:predicted phage terminase large subunit-like protein